MVGKLPALQFYVGDHQRDPGIRSIGYAAKGLWHDMLCLMHDSDRRGFLELNGHHMTIEQIARMTGGSVDEVKVLLTELEHAGIFSCTERGTIYSRRMVRDESKRYKCAEAGKKGGGNPILSQTFKGDYKGRVKGSPKQNPNPSSSSSISSFIYNISESENMKHARDLSAFFIEKILENNPKHSLKKPAVTRNALENWPIEIEKMIRLDSRSPPEVRKMIEFVTPHSFWAAHIMSAAKLREKWDTLAVQAAQKEKDSKNGSGGKSSTKSFDQTIDAIFQYRNSIKAKSAAADEIGRGQLFDGAIDSGSIISEHRVESEDYAYPPRAFG